MRNDWGRLTVYQKRTALRRQQAENAAWFGDLYPGSTVEARDNLALAMIELRCEITDAIMVAPLMQRVLRLLRR